MRRYACCPVFLVALTAADSAAATRLLVVVRGAGSGSEKAAAFASRAVLEAFRKDEGYELIDLARSLGDENLARATQEFAVAGELVEKGKRAYEALELDQAVEYLTTALKKYQTHAAYVTDIKGIADTLMLLGASYVLRGQSKRGRRWLARAVALNPDIVPDARLFNTSMRETHAAIAARVRKRPRGSLRVSSEPDFAEVFLDGKFVGVTPMVCDDITGGSHYLRLSKRGYAHWGSLVDVGRKEARQTAKLTPTKHFDDYDSLADTALKRLMDGTAAQPIDEAVDQLGVLSNADYVFIASVRAVDERVEVTAYQFDLNRQRLLQEQVHTFAVGDDPSAYAPVENFLATHFGAAVLGGGQGAQDAQGEAGLVGSMKAGDVGESLCLGMSCASVRVWTLIVGAGVGAITMGLGGSFWVLAKDDNKAFRESVQVSTEADALRNSGKRKALIGDALFTTGAMVLTAGLAVYFFWEPAPLASRATNAGAAVVAFPLTGGGGIATSLSF